MISLRYSTILLLAATCLIKTVACVEKSVTCGTSLNVHRLSCDIGVIRVKTSLYGRADEETCSQGVPASQLANTQCSQAGTVDNIRERCDGKKICEVNLAAVRSPDPCPSTNKYLETTYNCFPSFHMNVCEGSVAHLFCDPGQVIFVYGADYGRRDMNICSFGRPDGQLENVVCSRPNTIVADRCNGKNSCTFQVSNSLFGDPCQGTYKYLEVAYVCEFPLHPKKR